jgi:hypothetical protein
MKQLGDGIEGLAFKVMPGLRLLRNMMVNQSVIAAMN